MPTKENLKCGMCPNRNGTFHVFKKDPEPSPYGGSNTIAVCVDTRGVGTGFESDYPRPKRTGRFQGVDLSHQAIYCGTCGERANKPAKKPEPLPDTSHEAPAIVERFEQRMWGDDPAAKTARDRRAKRYEEAGYDVSVSIVGTYDAHQPLDDPNAIPPLVLNATYQLVAFAPSSVLYVAPDMGNDADKKLVEKGRKREAERRERFGY